MNSRNLSKILSGSLIILSAIFLVVKESSAKNVSIDENLGYCANSPYYSCVDDQGTIYTYRVYRSGIPPLVEL